MRELLRPPAHRGPVIAAGAVVLTVGVVLEQERIHPGLGVQVVIVAALAAGLLWLGLQGGLDGGIPSAHRSVLLVAGLLALEIALVRLSDLLGADFDSGIPSGAVFWTSAVEAFVAGQVAARRSSAVAALIAAIAGGVALLSAWDLVFSPDSFTPYRWLLLLLAVVFGIASLPMRGRSLRHAEQMVNAAGLAILTIGAAGIPSGLLLASPLGLPNFWEFVVLAAGLGLVAYACADRAPGPAYLGVANLLAFAFVVSRSGEQTLVGWPLVLLLVGAGLLAVGLRPRRPLPPEPEGRYGPGDSPLAARTAEDVTVRVHRD